MDQSSRITRTSSGKALIEHLIERFPYFDRETWEMKINEGRLLLDGQVALVDETLKKGQILTYRMPHFDEPPADLRWSVVAEDQWFLLTDKPGNLLVHRMGKSYTSNLVYLVRNAGNPEWSSADPAHRLDRETSGLVLFAKTKHALREILALWEGHQITKEYLAIVAPEGGAVVPRKGNGGLIDLPIGRVADPVKGTIQAVGVPGARESLTHWVWGSEVAPGRYQVRLQLETGRTHQIRVHMSAMGWPLVGDKLYGGPVAHRQALHAHRLAFVHPFSGKSVEYQSEMPHDWSTLCGLRSSFNGEI